MNLALIITIVGVMVGLVVALSIFFIQKKNREIERETTNQEIKELKEEMALRVTTLERKFESTLRRILSSEDITPYLNELPTTLDEEKVKLLNEALDFLHEYRYREAIVKFKEILPIAINNSERCALLNLIGLSQIKNELFPEAEKTFLDAINISKRSNLKSALVIATLQLGLVYHYLGKSRKSLKLAKLALRNARQINNPDLIAESLRYVGACYLVASILQGIFKYKRLKALRYLQQSLYIFNRTRNLNPQGHVLDKIGDIYITLNKPQKALKAYSRVLKIGEQTKDLQLQGYGLHGQGIAYRILKEFRDSFLAFKKALQIAKKINNIHWFITLLISLGDLYYDLRQMKKSIATYQFARDVLNNANVSERLGIIGPDDGVLYKIRRKIFVM